MKWGSINIKVPVYNPINSLVRSLMTKITGAQLYCPSHLLVKWKTWTRHLDPTVIRGSLYSVRLK